MFSVKSAPILSRYHKISKPLNLGKMRPVLQTLLQLRDVSWEVVNYHATTI